MKSDFILHPSDFILTGMVGLGRFELPTSRLSGVRSNQLSYRPALGGEPVSVGRELPAGLPQRINCHRTGRLSEN